MQRLRRAVIRIFRLAGPMLGMVTFICVGGFGLHAAQDWHRHGEFGAGFFHVHFHVGDHGHEHRGHAHPARDDHDHEIPPHRDQNRSTVLTIVCAFQDAAPAAPAVASPEPAPEWSLIEGVIPPRTKELATPANPRAPPAS